MRSVKNKANFQHQKLKTLCTLDTSDIALTKDVKQIINRKKLLNSVQKPRTNTRSKSITKSQINQALLNRDKKERHSIQRHNRSTLNTRTITTETKSKKSDFRARQRIRTEYDQSSTQKIILNNLQIFTTVKNVKFHMDEQYNVDPYYVVNTIKCSKQETLYTVKYLQRNKKTVYYVMKKSNNPKTIQKYERQIAMKEELTDLFKTNERKSFSCIYKVYRKDRFDNMFVVYHMEGEPLSWKKPLSKKLINNLCKNNMQIMKHLMVQLSKSIHILSAYGYYHSDLKLKNIFVELKEDEQNVKVSKVVKLGNLHKCNKIKDKKTLQTMALSLHTPPQILNFIMFQKQNKNFNRLWLEYIYRYEEAWRVNVWSLGILVLELLNQEPIQNKFIQVPQIIEFQKNIPLKCAFLFDKITDQKLGRLLKKMLSPNPHQRPSPEQIIVCLTS